MSPNSFVDLLPSELVCAVPIFHYTDAGGLLGVASSHKLRATEAFGLNDVAELRHGRRFIADWIDSQPGDAAVDAVKLILPDDDEEFGDAIFMCCASINPDDASQWRLYADATRGYSIELDPTVQLSVLARAGALPADRPTPPYRDNAIGTLLRDVAELGPWRHVIYTDEQKDSTLTFVMNSVSQRLKEVEASMAATKDEEEFDALGDDFNADISSALSTLAQLMKAEAFKGEAEVRAVANLMSDAHCYGVVRYVELGTRPKGAKAIRVVFDKPTQLPIVSVRMGPGQVAQNSRQAALSLLRRHEYEAEVLESTATIR